MSVNDDARDSEEGGPSIPVLLAIWLVCTVVAAVVWNGITSNSPGAQSPSFIVLATLGVLFGFGGVGLVWATIDIVRRP